MLLFDFTVNKEKNTIQVKREFAALLPHVWDAWTRPELLDLWWAPKPYETKTKSMEFKEGGTWLYAMIGPEKDVHWCRTDYQSIVPLMHFTGRDAFCDENGKISADFPSAFWTTSFHEDGDHTFVTIEIAYDQLSDLEKIIELGFKEGFTMALGNLDHFFEVQSKLKTK